MFLTSGYVPIGRILFKSGFLHTFRRDFSETSWTFLGWQVLSDFRLDVLQQQVLRNSSLLWSSFTNYSSTPKPYHPAVSLFILTDLSSLGVRSQQVDHLDASHKDLLLDTHVLELWSLGMDGSSAVEHKRHELVKIRTNMREKVSSTRASKRVCKGFGERWE